jgi:hypothetical protein
VGGLGLGIRRGWLWRLVELGEVRLVKISFETKMFYEHSLM